MDKKLQDLAWSVLPKEFKEAVKYKYNKTKTKKIKKECDLGFLNAHEGMFGVYNLTSDAEEEEMLTVPRSKVREQYALNVNALREGNLTDMQIEIATKVKDTLYYLFGSKCLMDEESKPAEPKEDKHFDNILKDSFRKERRLNIAAQIVASMIGSDDWTTWRGGSNKEIWHNMAKSSLEIADALISECEKGGGNA